MRTAQHKFEAGYGAGPGDWRTPPDLFARLDAEFGFSVDVAADAANACCDRSFDAEQDGLAQEWRGVCWMNPPYSRGQIGKWIAKAYAESRKVGCIVVALVHARTDTTWWHEWAMKAAEVRFVWGRVCFVHPVTLRRKRCPTASVILIFRADSEGPPLITSYRVADSRTSDQLELGDSNDSSKGRQTWHQQGQHGASTSAMTTSEAPNAD
jgi:site-specific DNA-methyltransferase (adenine-specific)